MAVTTDTGLVQLEQDSTEHTQAGLACRSWDILLYNSGPFREMVPETQLRISRQTGQVRTITHLYGECVNQDLTA